MKRWFAVLLLMLGGLSVEAVRPVQCELIANTRIHGKRRAGWSA
jgi:hypothetical protein